VAAAKGAFQAGQASFNEADYKRAIDYWEDAFRRDCTASALLLNLARAYELSGNRPQAVEALQTYLARTPEASDKDSITRRIEVLNRQIEQDESNKAAAPPPAPAATATAPPATTAEPVEPTPPPSNEQSDSYWIGPVILGGAGTVMVVAGTLYWSSGKSDENKAKRQCQGRSDCPQEIADLGNDGIIKEKVGVALGAGGLAAIGGAVVWYLLASPEPAPAPASPAARAGSSSPVAATRAADNPIEAVVVPSFAEGYSGLSVVGTF
jgi:tetratricopeptide (TPR) repeat protein